MKDAGSLEFAHARIGARWGARPDEALWRRIETTRELDAVLGLARGSSLAEWLGGIDAQSGLHPIEQRLRERWRQRVTEVAGWMPPPWQPSLRWCAGLVDLPALQPWTRSAPLPDWAAGGGPAAAPPDDAARDAPARLLQRWFMRWRQLLPTRAGRQAIDAELVPLVERHRQAFAAPRAVDGWALRRGLQSRLVLLLRRHPTEAVGAFVYLALCAIELERLRGEIVRRAAFPRLELAA